MLVSSDFGRLWFSVLATAGENHAPGRHPPPARRPAAKPPDAYSFKGVDCRGFRRAAEGPSRPFRRAFEHRRARVPAHDRLPRRFIARAATIARVLNPIASMARRTLEFVCAVRVSHEHFAQLGVTDRFARFIGQKVLFRGVGDILGFGVFPRITGDGPAACVG